MKLYNIRLPDELSYALKKAGADHVRQTLASSYGVECKTTRTKPVPPKRKTKDEHAERKTTKAVIDKRKTGMPPEKLRVIDDHLMPDLAFEAVEKAVEEKKDSSGDKYAEMRAAAAAKLQAQKNAPKQFTGVTKQA